MLIACVGASAASAQIRIGEFRPTDLAQYVEIYNESAQEVDISGWSYDFGTATTRASIAPGTRLAAMSCILLVTKDASRSTSSHISLASPAGAVVQTSTYNQALAVGYSFYPQTALSSAQTSPESIGMHDNLRIPCVNPAVEIQTIVPTTIPEPSPTVHPTEAPPATPTPTHTATPSQAIVISEVMVAPTAPNPEWVELYNPNLASITLTNWQIDDGANAGSAPFALSTVIGAQSHVTIELPSAIFNNSSDEVRLLDDQDQLIAFTSYAKSYPNETWALLPTGTYCHQSSTKNAPNTQMCLHETTTPTSTTLPTPTIIVATTPTPTVQIGQPTPSPLPTSQPTQIPTITPTATPISATPTPTTHAAQSAPIYISEFMARPATGQAEWVELYNSGSSSVTLTGWSIDDVASGGSSPRLIPPLTIAGYSYATYELSSAIFNNDADSVRLLNNVQSVIDELTYADAIAEKSFSRNDISSRFVCATDPTRSMPNLTCAENGDDTASDDEAHVTKDDTIAATSSTSSSSSATTNTPGTTTNASAHQAATIPPGEVAGLFVVETQPISSATAQQTERKSAHKPSIALSIATVVTSVLALIRLGIKLMPW